MARFFPAAVGAAVLLGFMAGVSPGTRVSKFKPLDITPPTNRIPRSAFSPLPPTPAPRQARITLAWENDPKLVPGDWTTGIEGSTNLRDWYVLARLPYAATNVLTLTNRPPFEWYRAFNAY